MNMPFISVVIPVYNGEETIKRCMEAVRGQDYPKDRYEVIVVDDGSIDETRTIAQKYADIVISHSKNLGLSRARMDGMKVAKGEIIVNTDSDVVMFPNTLAKISAYFLENKNVDAVTGLLSKDQPNINFFSQYKNLYMNYIFKKLPEKVMFLYGSIHALRKEVAHLYSSGFDIGEDTAFGQRLTAFNKQIAFLKDLEVVHLKKYTLISFIKNDFLVSFNWAKIFLKYKGWRQLGRNKMGFAHASKEQLVSVILAPIILIFCLSNIVGWPSFILTAFILLGWFVLNRRFISHLKKEKGLYFGIIAIFVTFVDNIIMASGSICGFFAYVKSKIWSHKG
ncbi:MAG: glycosyltransferase [Candidatus Omnitrophica bacterium]|nr:glycosyltransferase [Candidatus Omnitrophota bacterium]